MVRIYKKILACDRLTPEVRQEWREGQLVDIFTLLLILFYFPIIILASQVATLNSVVFYLNFVQKLIWFYSSLRSFYRERFRQNVNKIKNQQKNWNPLHGDCINQERRFFVGSGIKARQRRILSNFSFNKTGTVWTNCSSEAKRGVFAWSRNIGGPDISLFSPGWGSVFYPTVFQDQMRPSERSEAKPTWLHAEWATSPSLQW